MRYGRTLADDYRDADTEGQAAILDAFARFPADAGDSFTVRTPCCGIATSADNIMDGSSAGLGWIFPCCKQTRFGRKQVGGWTLSKLARALGADADTIRAVRAREMVEERTRNLDSWNRKKLATDVDDELPKGTKDIPGTDPPG